MRQRNARILLFSGGGERRPQPRSGETEEEDLYGATVGNRDDDWVNELHLKNSAYPTVAREFDRVIRSLPV